MFTLIIDIYIIAYQLPSSAHSRRPYLVSSYKYNTFISKPQQFAQCPPNCPPKSKSPRGKSSCAHKAVNRRRLFGIAPKAR